MTERTQALLEDLEALREAHRAAQTQDDFDGLAARMKRIEAVSASSSERSKAETAAVERVRTAVVAAIDAHRNGRPQPVDLSGLVFALMQAVRQGSTGYEPWSKP